ncbi:MAG: restriction endonuclease subunit S [Vulcanimicrobiaceae bacterium]
MNPPLAASLSDGDGVSFMPMAAVDASSVTAVDRETRLYSEVCRGYTPFLDGDVLVAKITPCFENGKIAQARLSRRYGFGSTEFHVVRPHSDQADARYLVHFLRQDRIRKQGESRMTGSAGQRRVPVNFLAGLTIPLPPLPEQRRIAEILDKADALRAKRRAALTQLDTLTQSIFLDMFGDPATNPKGWPKPTLLEMLATAEVFVDGDWVESKDQDPEGEVRLIQLADVGDGVYLDKSARFLTKQTALRLKCTPLRSGDILVARMPDPLGRACLFPGDRREAITVVDVCIIRPGANGPDPVWLMCCINTLGFRSLIAREATGTTRERISRGNLSRLRIISPPQDLQRAFVLQHETLHRLRSGYEASYIELETLFASLQHRAFRGEL